MAGIKQYIKESKQELTNKVSWPTLGQLQNSTVVVLVATFIVAGVIFLIDLSFSQFMKLLYKFF